MPVRVKICGVTSLSDAAAAVECGADAIGLNFYRHSARYVTPSAAARIVATLPPAVCAVGVFVDESRENVEQIVAAVRLKALQFHGTESPAFCAGWPVKVIKALSVRDRTWLETARAYSVDWVLADAFVEGEFGGTGKRLNPALLQGFDRERLILAGGLTPENVAAATRAVRPFAVDVASGVESAPGKKDRRLLRRFVEHAKTA
jgi:phosphoribosylanthranilate isomerase